MQRSSRNGKSTVTSLKVPAHLRLESLEGRVMLHGTVSGEMDPCSTYLVGDAQQDDGMMHVDPSSLPSELMIHGTEMMPNPVAAPTARNIECGYWSDPSIWENGRVPSAGDDVLITRHVVINTTDAQAHAILVTDNAGLIFDPHVNTGLKVGTLVVAGNGILQIGNEQMPVDPSVRAEIVIADQPLDLVKDPKQFLTGLLAIDHATVRIHGAAKTTEATQLRLAVEPLAGQTTLTLENAPTGWRVGDRVVLPPTEAIKYLPSDLAPHLSEEFRITAINGNVVTLDHALRFDHRGARDANGALTFLPHLVNLSRNVVILSENPEGTRGHVFLTHRVDADIRYAAFTDLGRTTGRRSITQPLTRTGPSLISGPTRWAAIPFTCTICLALTTKQTRAISTR
jgi:hypothetical protein